MKPPKNFGSKDKRGITVILGLNNPEEILFRNITKNMVADQSAKIAENELNRKKASSHYFCSRLYAAVKNIGTIRNI